MNAGPHVWSCSHSDYAAEYLAVSVSGGLARPPISNIPGRERTLNEPPPYFLFILIR